jgi:primary-amine oxidase
MAVHKHPDAVAASASAQATLWMTFRFCFGEAVAKSQTGFLYLLPALTALWFISCAVAQETYVPQHPLDALTSEEIASAKSILASKGDISATAEFANLTLEEPPKADVLKWQPGQSFTRVAFAIVRQNKETYEARIDLANKKVLSFKQLAGVEAPVLDKEWRAARDAFMHDPRFTKAMQARGYPNLNDVFCTPNPAGYFAEAHYEGRRIFRIPCFDRTNKLHPLIGRPIEGVLGIVDAETLEILDIILGPAVVLKDPPNDYGASLAKPAAPQNPVSINAPEGPNIRIRNNLEVEWNNWRFHVRGDRRAGVILSLVSFGGGKTPRPIAYQMNVSEMFVPYMDPDPAWGTRTFLDVGEFGLGYLMSSLEPGVDCPDTSLFADLTLPSDSGEAYTMPRGLCLFERPTGDPAWRHYSSSQKKVRGIPQIELVVRSAATVGNYDYLIDYVFSPQGVITLRVGASGYDAVKSTTAATMDEPSAQQDTRYGSLIAPYTVAPFHDHYINFRIDLDVDGTGNTLLLDHIEPTTTSSPRKSIWTLKTEVQLTETAIRSHAETVRISNSSTHNRLRQNPSYQISSHHQATSILSNDDWSQKRAAFSAATIWITKFNPNEHWAAGDYPNQSREKLGLPDYIADQEPITNADLVLWYTMGFRHITHPEDFPILPTLWHEVTLRPSFFFDMDPSMTFNPGAMENQQ